MEALKCETLSLLYQVTRAQAVKVSQDLGLTVTSGLSKIEIISLIANHLDKEVDKTNEAEVYMNLKKDLQLMVSETNGVNSQSSVSGNAASSTVPETWRKDFKIFGQVGEPGQKDKLSYSSLTRQIDAGLRRGFAESEIIDGVIRAINPSLQLRSYVEGREHRCDWGEQLTLRELRDILFSHFHEKTPTELYQELCTLSQKPKEEPMAFLIRALDMRQKVMFASESSPNRLQYSAELVQGMFLHALQTGLSNDFIRQELRDILDKQDVHDEELIKRMNQAASLDKERRQRSHLKVRASSVEVDCEETRSQTLKPPRVKEQSKKGTLVSEVKELQDELSDVRDLRAEVHALREQLRISQNRQSPTQDVPQRPKKCQQCQQSGQRCHHCFYCGSGEHFIAGCKKRRFEQRNESVESTRQGNANRLQRGDAL